MVVVLFLRELDSLLCVQAISRQLIENDDDERWLRRPQAGRKDEIIFFDGTMGLNIRFRLGFKIFVKQKMGATTLTEISRYFQGIHQKLESIQTNQYAS